MIDILIDTLIDSIKLLPFLFITYLIMEYIEHKTNLHSKELIKKSGKFGPFIGSFLGIFPQCGFSAAASNLYAGRIITLGTLIAIFLSTSDEMLPILISEAVSVKIILGILLLKFIIGFIVGFIIDLIMRQKMNNNSGDIAIKNLCEHEHCHCETGILKSSIKHTLNIFLFILLISLLLNVVIFFIGEENICNLILNKPIIGPAISGLIGLIPNCASSVVITKLYLSGVINLSTMLSGLLVGSGLGLIVLFRVNKNLKENFKIVFILYLIGVISGIFIGFTGITL